MSPAIQIPPPSTLESARTHHAKNHLLEAANAYRQTLESNPQSQPALLGLSLIARQSNQLAPALRMAQAALTANPNHALAWANYGDLQLAARNPPEAQAAYRRALVLDSTVAVAHYGLANTYALEENYPAALPHFAAAAQLNPAIAEFHFAHAFSLGKHGEHLKAIAAYRRAVLLRSNFASAWLNLGVELIADGRDQIAELCYTQALACAANPDTQISTHLNHGHLLRSRKNFPAAQTHYQSALTLASKNSLDRLAEIQVAFTYLYLEQQQFDSAHKSLQSAEDAQLHHLSAKPNPEIPNVRGILLLAQHTANDPGDLSNGTAEGAGGFNPRNPSEKSNGALASEEKVGRGFIPGTYAIQGIGPLGPEVGFPAISPELGPSSRACSAPAGDHLIHQAIQAFRQAEIQGHKTAPSNRGNALLRLGRVAEALEAHQTALNLDPHHPGVRYNLALTQLRAGNFKEGWQNYEIRWRFREVHPHPRRFPQPRWRGEPLPSGSSLFIHAEQGLGDTIQFLRYLQFLPPIPILLEVQPPLTRLIADSLKRWNDFCRPQELTCHPERSEGSAAPAPSIQVISQGDPIPPFTHHIPLMSLPALFKTIPTPIPYLFPPANQESVGAPSQILLTPPLGQEWEEQTPKQEKQTPGCPTLAGSLSFRLGWEGQISGSDLNTPKIGLHWAGNPNYRADRERSTTLQTFLPLLQIPKIHWISLQKGPTALEIPQLPSEVRPPNPIQDACSQDRDLADTAAILQPLDLILSTDSAVAHLAGAMGKPLWLLLPWQSDWRWMQDTLDTPWYPQLRIFRQSSPHNWPELIRRVAAELQRWLSARSASNSRNESFPCLVPRPSKKLSSP